jgi:hypothetical protein
VFFSRILFLCLAAAPLADLAAQVSEGGLPHSFNHKVAACVEVVRMGPVDAAALRAEDEASAHRGVPFRFGFGFDVNLGLDNAGTAETTADGGYLWRLRIECPGAHSINLLYDAFWLPEGATLFVHGRSVLGAFTARNNKDDGMFATAPIPGDACTVEYHEPRPVVGFGRLTIGRIVHGYRDIFSPALKNFGDSGACEINVNCLDGAPWRDQARSVGLIVCDSGTRCCTGALVRNTGTLKRAFFLTAAHCIEGETLSRWVIIFNYQSAGCLSAEGSTRNSVSGVTQRATNVRSDFALVELSELPPVSYKAFLAGWSNEKQAAATTTVIHHPAGDIKKISFDNDPPTESLFENVRSWRVSWDKGATEPGSSGAPLFDANRRIVGQLYGGYSTCADPTAPDYFGRFSESWGSGADSRSRLKDWLDPAASGAATLDGADLYATPSVTLTTPPNEASVFGEVDVAAAASSSDGISQVEFLVGSETQATVAAEPYTFRWNTTALAQGPYTVTAVAKTPYGLTAETSVTVHVSEDCNGNGIADRDDLANGTSLDCNLNGIPDECDISAGAALDCTGNGIPDSCDIARGTEQDADRNGIPDSCENVEKRFRRGDLNADTVWNIADAVFVLDYLFGGGATPLCLKSGDSNDDGKVGIADAVFILAYLFASGPSPDNPGAECGADPTPDALTCDSFSPCER